MLLKKSFINTVEKIEVWKELLKNSINSVEELDKICKCSINTELLRSVVKKYPMRINPYYLSLIQKKDDPIWKQCIPDEQELTDPIGLEDPLCEERDMPVKGLTHRYPDRVLLLISNQCSMYCRFCTRKRKVGDPFKRITKEQIFKCIDYIREHTEVRDVLLSGGDPLLLSDNYLECILKELRTVKHVEIIRIGTRVPCALPQRITPELCSMLSKYHPLFINVHFNHPREITPESSKACEMLADTGISLGNQSVLLKGVNDDPNVYKELMHKLLQIRVRPYYLYQADYTRGTDHFRTKVEKGMEIIKNLRGFTSGLACPTLVIDAPGGSGKIPIQPDYIIRRENSKIVLRNFRNDVFEYAEP